MYIKTNWVAGETEVSAENLNKIEEGIYKNSLEVGSFTEEVEGSFLAIDGTKEGYLENVEIHGNTWQDAENLADIRSVGTKVEGQELYEIDVVSCGKNLFDVNKVIPNSMIKKSDGTIGVYSGIQASDFIRIKPNTNYYCTSSDQMAYYDKDKKYITGNSGLYHTISPTNAMYMRFTSVMNTDVQLEEGTQATPYEPYKEDKLTILSPTPLEKVGNIADRIVCKDGVYGVEKNIGNLTVDGSVLPKIATQNNNRADLCYVEFTAFDNEMVSNSNAVFADGFVDIKIFNQNSPADIICAYSSCVTYTSHKLRFLIPVSDLSSVNPNGVAEFFKNNPTVVRYQTTQPTFIPLPHDQQIKLRTFANKTHISFDTEIQPTLKAQVPKSLGATVNTHTSQIDSLNKELDRVKKLEESTVSTVTSGKAFTTVSETSGGYFEDVKIEGKTLVNLAKQPTNNGYINTQYATISKVTNIKPSTEYTYIIRNNGSEMVKLYLNNKGGFAWTPVDVGVNSTVIGKAKSLPTISGDIWLSLQEAETVEQNLQIVLLEGDHTDKDISYFEGLKSVGQDTDGIEILSHTGNLFEKFSQENTSVNNYYDKTTNTYYSSSRVSVESLYACVRVGGEDVFVGFEDNGVAEISYRFDDNICNNFENAYINNEGIITKPTTLINSKNRKYLIIGFRTRINGSIATLKDLYINLKTDNGYAPYKSNKKQILYYNPTTQAWEKPILREWDSIEKHDNGKYYYHKRSEEVVLNGSESWSGLTKNQNTVLSVIDSFSSKFNAMSNTNIISDRFIKLNSQIYNLDVEGVYIGRDLNLRVDTSKLSTQDVTGFKTWLQANPTTVVYQSEKEEVYECTNLDLITYNGETNLIVSSGAIQPKITLKVLSNVSNVVKLLQEKVSVLENNLSSYMINQNAMMLNTRYISDTTEFTVNTFANVVRLCEPNSDEKLYKLIRDNIVVGKDNYERNWMEEVVTFYWLEFKLSDEMYNELMLLMEMQHSTSIIEGEEIE